MLEHLTPPQKQLFFDLAQLSENGSLIAPFIPIPTGVDEYTLYLRGNHNYQFRSYDDLIALCVIGLVDWELTRMGAYKQFTLSKFGKMCYRSRSVEGFERGRNRPIHNQTQQLTAAVRQMLNGRILDNVLREINVVRRELEAEFVNAWRVQRSIQMVGEAITKRFDQVSLNEMSELAICYGRWCQAVAREVEQQDEMIYA